MTLLELIRMRLNEAEKEPGAPGKLICAVDALADYVECQGASAHGDMRRRCWIATYAVKLGSSHIRDEYGPDARSRARVAARAAVEDFDAFFASEVRP